MKLIKLKLLLILKNKIVCNQITNNLSRRSITKSFIPMDSENFAAHQCAVAQSFRITDLIQCLFN